DRDDRGGGCDRGPAPAVRRAVAANEWRLAWTQAIVARRNSFEMPPCRISTPSTRLRAIFLAIRQMRRTPRRNATCAPIGTSIRFEAAPLSQGCWHSGVMPAVPNIRDGLNPPTQP